MRKRIGLLAAAAALLTAAGVLSAGVAEIDEDLTATRRVFPNIGAGLRAAHHSANGNYYVLASPTVGIAVFDAKEKQLSVIGAPPEPSVTGKAGHSPVAFGEDCDVDARGNVYLADRGSNRVTVFAPDGRQLRSFSVNSLISLAALPDDEVAVTTNQPSHLVTVYGADGKIVREFGDPESFSARPELDRYVNLGRVVSDPQGHVYYGFTYRPEPLVRQFDRFGYAGLEFEFTGLDAFPEASAARKAIEREAARSDPPTLPAILTAFGVDPVNGDVWMGLHNTLLHFDKDSILRSEYQVYTPKGYKLDASVILVEEERLLIGADPLGVYEFPRPDRKH
jgi:hypothetical protein